MDQPTRALAEYACGVRFESLEPGAVAAVVRHLADSIGCALGALDARPAVIARRLAATASSTFGASVLGLPQLTTAEQAAFANGCAIRYLDFNDTGIGGHPSDMIPAVLAVAEAQHTSGPEVIAAIHAAYEAVAALRRGGFTPRTWNIDQAQTVIGAAVGAGVVLRLDREQMANAVSLAITPNVPLRATRAGRLSDWKGCAAAQGGMMGVLAARWAAAGLTGPPEPFLGTGGLCEMLRIEPIRLEAVGEPRTGLSAVQATGLKRYPAEYSAQGPIASVLDLRPAVRLDAVERVNVALHWGGWHEIGGGQGDLAEKLCPSTRESADHSLHYLVAVALADGQVTADSFDEARLQDPALRRLMQRVSVTEDPHLTREHAGELPNWPSTVEVVLGDGTRLRRRARWPKGHPRNPLSDAELQAKFIGLAVRLLPEAQGRQLLEACWSVESVADIGELGALFRKIDLTGAPSSR